MFGVCVNTKHAHLVRGEQLLPEAERGWWQLAEISWQSTGFNDHFSDFTDDDEGALETTN